MIVSAGGSTRAGECTHLELVLRPTPPIISAVRRSVIGLYRELLADRDASDRIGVVTHELLENVLRHSSDGEGTLLIRAERGPAPRLTIATRNRASAADIESLRARAAAMADNPWDYYADAMRTCSDSDEEGGLGLARISAESEMALAVHAEGDSVSVVATMSDFTGPG